MAQIKYCIWDVGNVVYHYTLDPLHEWCEKHTSNPDYFAQKKGLFNYNDYMKGIVSFEELCRQLCEFYSVPYGKEHEEEIFKAFHQGVKDFFPQTRKMQEELFFTGIENCILSNALPVLAADKRVSDIIKPEHIFCSFDLGLLKPDPQIYKEVRKKLGCKFEELIFVDDKKKNTSAAAELGIHAITYNAETIETEIKKVLSVTNNNRLFLAANSLKKARE